MVTDNIDTENEEDPLDSIINSQHGSHSAYQTKNNGFVSRNAINRHSFDSMKLKVSPIKTKPTQKMKRINQNPKMMIIGQKKNSTTTQNKALSSMSFQSENDSNLI